MESNMWIWHPFDISPNQGCFNGYNAWNIIELGNQGKCLIENYSNNLKVLFGHQTCLILCDLTTCISFGIKHLFAINAGVSFPYYICYEWLVLFFYRCFSLACIIGLHGSLTLLKSIRKTILAHLSCDWAKMWFFHHSPSGGHSFVVYYNSFEVPSSTCTLGSALVATNIFFFSWKV